MTEYIPTPASRDQRPTVAVLGGGIAGLTAAHELAERGFLVTVYESRLDERNGVGSEQKGSYPPVKLGGLAASQYSTVGTHDGSQAELRPFPGRQGQPSCSPRRAVAGEHGFRFFPAFYLHIWDLFQRIPVYQQMQTTSGAACWTPTPRTVYDNVRRVITKGVTVDGQPTLVFPSELPRSPAEVLGILKELAILGFTATDIATYVGRLVSYLTTSPLRRAKELESLSAYDYLVGHDRRTGLNRYSYTPKCDAMLRQMPRILVALDSQWGDARTNMSTYLQLYLNMDRRDNKADGVLNGPTSESWLDHWYRYLAALGVEFVHGAATGLDSPASDPSQPPHLRSRAQVTFADGVQVTPDYTVVAVDAPAAEYITAPLRAAGTGGTVAALDGFATMPPPPDGPLQPAATRPQQRRDPYSMDEMGRLPWDRFQTLCGIQYYFDTEFQLLRGHLLLTSTEWALSSINQSGLWETQRVLDPDGHISVLSVDIGDFNTPSGHVTDEFGQPKAARDCTADEIAAEVWRQIVTALTSTAGAAEPRVMPEPIWYALDRSLIMAVGPGQGRGRVVRNESPYLVPIVGDWDNRPGTEPWNPHGTSLIDTPSDEVWLEDLERWNVWQARHGGYQVHNNSVVFAGTWTKTFTRVTSMESACESGRHAVNAILDHYIWVESGGSDRREKFAPLDWEFPYGFVDQGLSSPIRMPTPAGDYCYIFDIENREPGETRPLRVLDTFLCQQSLPHPLDFPAGPPIPLLTGGLQMFTPTTDYNKQVLAYLQMLQQSLQQWMTMAAGLPFPTGPSAMPLIPQMPFIPPPSAPMPPDTSAPPAPGDYTQQLFGYLQAWRQYLEQTTGTTGHQPGAAQSPTAQAAGGAGSDSVNFSGQAKAGRPSNEITPPPVLDGSRAPVGFAASNGSSSTWPPTFEAVRSLFGSMVPPEIAFSPANRITAGATNRVTGGPTNRVAASSENRVGPAPKETDGLKSASQWGTFGSPFRFLSGPSAKATPSALTEVSRAAKRRIAPDSSPQLAPKTLFSVAKTAAPRLRDAGQTPSP